MKWIAPLPAYLAVALGLFGFHSAWGALLGFHFAILLSLLVAKPGISFGILFKNTKIKWVILSIFLCGSSGITVYLLRDTLGFARDLAAQTELLGLTPIMWIPFIAYFALVNPFVEEYFWRGYLGHQTKSLHFSDVIYAGYHGSFCLERLRPGHHVRPDGACHGRMVLEANCARGWWTAGAGDRAYGGRLHNIDRRVLDCCQSLTRVSEFELRRTFL